MTRRNLFLFPPELDQLGNKFQACASLQISVEGKMKRGRVIAIFCGFFGLVNSCHVFGEGEEFARHLRETVMEADEYTKPVVRKFHRNQKKNISNYLKPKMISDYGYPVEVHNYTTEDGYINTLHRMPQRDGRKPRRAVFVQHGLFGTSADYVMGSPQKSLGTDF